MSMLAMARGISITLLIALQVQRTYSRWFSTTWLASLKDFNISLHWFICFTAKEYLYVIEESMPPPPPKSGGRFKLYMWGTVGTALIAGGTYAYFQYLTNDNYLFSKEVKENTTITPDVAAAAALEQTPSKEQQTEVKEANNIDDHIPLVEIIDDEPGGDDTVTMFTAVHDGPAITETVSLDTPAAATESEDLTPAVTEHHGLGEEHHTSADIIQNMTDLATEIEQEIGKKLGILEHALEQSFANLSAASSDIDTFASGVVTEIGKAVDSVMDQNAALPASAAVMMSELDAESKRVLKLLEDQYMTQIKDLLSENIKLKEQMDKMKEMETSYFEAMEERVKKLYDDRLQEGVKGVASDAIEKLEAMEAKFREGLEKNYETLTASVARQRENLTTIFNSQKNAIETSQLEKRVIGGLTHALVELKKTAMGSVAAPLAQQIKSLGELAKHDKLLETIVGSLPQDIGRRGITTVEQLRKEFGNIATEARRVALLPNDQTFFGQALSTIASKLIVPEKGMVAGNDTDSILARAEELLRQGQVSKAISEVESLGKQNQKMGDLTQEWIATAKDRVVIEDLVKVLEAKLGAISNDIKSNH
eukprot:gene15319-18148_t